MSIQELRPALPSQARVGQATVVEQSRAVAEVQAAIVVAQQCPRDSQAAVRAMREACGQMQLAERAFYSYPRGKDKRGKPLIISGPSVHLARELARCWGNIQYGISELRRDDQGGQSEMLAFAWDVQTNTRNASVFINPHLRDKKEGGPELLTDMRDIYELNANNGARRVREAIFNVLPVWFTEEAKDRCTKTLADGGGKPLPQRIADAIAAFEDLGVKTPQLEERIGSPVAGWTPQDLAQLHVLITSIRRNEIRKDEAFPAPEQQRLTAADLARPQNGNGNGHAPEPAAAAGETGAQQDTPPPADDSAPGLSDKPGTLTSDQRKALTTVLRELGYTRDDPAAKREVCEKLAGRKFARSTTDDMSEAEAERVTAELGSLGDREALDRRLAEIDGAQS